jgi:signal transduction histidine kinase
MRQGFFERLLRVRFKIPLFVLPAVLLNKLRRERQLPRAALVAQRRAELGRLALQLQSLREVEKSWLARDLHDELGSLLIAAKFTLTRMRVKSSHDPEVIALIEKVSGLLNEVLGLKYSIIEHLYPPTLIAFGLTGALAALCQEKGKQWGVSVHTELVACRLSADAELCIYTLVQESLMNIGKHAGASDIWVSLKLEDSAIRVEVADNGVGFDPEQHAPGSHGLFGMRFRAESMGASMWVVSRPGEGTIVIAKFPQNVIKPSVACQDAAPRH